MLNQIKNDFLENGTIYLKKIMERAMTFDKGNLEKIKFFITTQDIKVESTHINHIRVDNEAKIKVTAKGNENNVTLFFRDLTAFLG